jgi:hypothetical protein
MEAHRKQTGKSGINQQSLELYIGSAKGYLGKNSSFRFTSKDGQSTVTSSFVFDYDLLGVPLDRQQEHEEEMLKLEIEGHLIGKVEYIDLAGKPMLKCRIRTTSTYKHDEKEVKKEVFTTVYAADLQTSTIFETEQHLVLVGQLTEKEWSNKDGEKGVKRTLILDSVRLKSEQIDAFKPVEDAPEF